MRRVRRHSPNPYNRTNKALLGRASGSRISGSHFCHDRISARSISLTAPDPATSFRRARVSAGKIRAMERVLGVGGYFIRAADPAALGAWYRDCLGARSRRKWRLASGSRDKRLRPRVRYGVLGSQAQQTMLNFGVRRLGCDARATARQGSRRGPRNSRHAGRRAIGWVTDPEGNRVELWQPG